MLIPFTPVSLPPPSTPILDPAPNTPTTLPDPTTPDICSIEALCICSAIKQFFSSSEDPRTVTSKTYIQLGKCTSRLGSHDNPYLNDTNKNDCNGSSGSHCDNTGDR